MGSASAFVKAIHPHIQIEIEKKKQKQKRHFFGSCIQVYLTRTRARFLSPLKATEKKKKSLFLAIRKSPAVLKTVRLKRTGNTVTQTQQLIPHACMLSKCNKSDCSPNLSDKTWGKAPKELQGRAGSVTVTFHK